MRWIADPLSGHWAHCAWIGKTDPALNRFRERQHSGRKANPAFRFRIDLGRGRGGTGQQAFGLGLCIFGFLRFGVLWLGISLRSRKLYRLVAQLGFYQIGNLILIGYFQGPIFKKRR